MPSLDQLVRQDGETARCAERRLEIKFHEPGAEAHVFAFG